MRKSLFLALAGVLGLGGATVTACGDASTGDAPGAGIDAPSDAKAADVVGSENVLPPPTDASQKSCALDNGDDPVLLCTQKLVLKSVHDAVFAAAKGVGASWDATTFAPDTDGTGAPLHDVHDDAAYAAACGTYAASASRYGDTELTQTLDLDLVALAALLKTELATLPDEYAGDLYASLRTAAVGLRVVNRNDDAAALDERADAIGRGIFGHFLVLSTTAPDAGAFDAGDGGDAGSLPPGDGVLAVDATNKDYAPADVATGALALVDMAVRHAGDDPDSAVRYVSAAQQSFDHIYARGRDATTHLYPRLLSAGTGTTHDDPSPRAAAPQDLLATVVTAAVAYALFRANALVVANVKLAPIALLANNPFVGYANDAIAALNGTPSLYDADKGGYVEGYVPSSGTMLTNKPTRANALAFSAIHRADVVGLSPYHAQLKTLRTVLGTRTPLGSGLLSATSGQSAYFASVAKDFSVPPASYTLGDAGDAGPFVAHPNSYVSAAVFAAVSAFEEEWDGYP